MKKMPERTCVVTKEKTLKKDLEVIKKAQQTKILDRILEINIPDTIYDQLIEIVK